MFLPVRVVPLQTLLVELTAQEVGANRFPRRRHLLGFHNLRRGGGAHINFPNIKFALPFSPKFRTSDNKKYLDFIYKYLYLF